MGWGSDQIRKLSARRRRRRHLEIQFDILARELYLEFIAKSEAPDAADRSVSSSQYVSAEYHGFS